MAAGMHCSPGHCVESGVGGVVISLRALLCQGCCPCTLDLRELADLSERSSCKMKTHPTGTARASRSARSQPAPGLRLRTRTTSPHRRCRPRSRDLPQALPGLCLSRSGPAGGGAWMERAPGSDVSVRPAAPPPSASGPRNAAEGLRSIGGTSAIDASRVSRARALRPRPSPPRRGRLRSPASAVGACKAQLFLDPGFS